MNVVRKLAIAGGMTGAAAIGAVAGVTMLSPAGAQTATTAPAASSPAAPAAPAPSSGANGSAASGNSGHQGGPHQANGKTETPLTGDDLAKVTAGVQSAVPGATIDRAETDADGATYEAHITKADGTRATVKFDQSFAVTSVVDGMA